VADFSDEDLIAEAQRRGLQPAAQQIGPTDEDLVAEAKRRGLYGAPKPSAPPVDVATDMRRSIGTGLQKGVAEAVGLPRMFKDAARSASQMAGVPAPVSEMIAGGAQNALAVASKIIPGLPNMGFANSEPPRAADIEAEMHKITGPKYEPQTVPGQYVKTVASMAPNALFGGGGLGARALQVVAPGVMSEAGGQMTKGTEMEGPARAAGAIIGGVGAGVAGKTADDFLNGVGGSLKRFADSRQGASGSQINSLFGSFQPREGAAATTTRDVVDKQLLRIAGRRGLTDAKAEELAQEAEAAGRNPIAAQVLGEPGLRRLQTNARMPGKTGQKVADVVKARRSGQGERLSAATDKAFGDTTRTAAQGSLDAQYATMSPQYNKLLDGAKVSSNIYNGRIAPILQTIPDAIQRRILSRAGQVAEGEGAFDFDGLPMGRKLQYMKIALGDEIKNMGSAGLDASIRRNLTRSLNDLRDAMEDAIPGYKALNARWADAAQSEEALGWADELFAGGKDTLRPEEVRAQFEAFTPAQQEHALVSVRNRIMQTIEDRTKTGVRKTNVAEPFLSDTFTKRMRAILGEKADALLRAIGVEDKDFNELGSVIPRAGSDTLPMFADLIDQASIPTGKGDMAAKALQFVGGRIQAGLSENARNKVGDKLIDEMTPAQIRAFRRTMRENIAAREARTGGAARAGAASTVIAGDERR